MVTIVNRILNTANNNTNHTYHTNNTHHTNNTRNTRNTRNHRHHQQEKEKEEEQEEEQRRQQQQQQQQQQQPQIKVRLICLRELLGDKLFNSFYHVPSKLPAFAVWQLPWVLGDRCSAIPGMHSGWTDPALKTAWDPKQTVTLMDPIQHSKEEAWHMVSQLDPTGFSMARSGGTEQADSKSTRSNLQTL